MLSYLNPVPLINYFREPSADTAKAAIDFLSYSGSELAITATKAQYVFAGTLTIALLLYSRSSMIEEETSYSREGTTDFPANPLYIFSRFFFIISLISSFTYVSCRGGSMLANHATSWIKPPL